MTDPRDRVITDPGIGPVAPDSCSTLRSMVAADEVAADEVATESATGGPVYYEPTPLQAATNHKTLELETVKLSRDIDPRKLPTELSLPRAPAALPSDSGWPQAEVAVSTRPEPLPPRRWRIRALLLTLLGVLLLVVLARGRAHRADTKASALSVGQGSQGLPPGPVIAPERSPAPGSAPSGLASDGEPSAPSAASAPSAPSAQASSAVSPGAAPTASPLEPPRTRSTSLSRPAAHGASGPRSGAVNPSLPPSVGREQRNTGATAKPKRAIY